MGWEFHGRVSHTLVGGKLVFELEQNSNRTSRSIDKTFSA
jgi:dihydroorotase-like cyclic amidohydrolase